MYGLMKKRKLLKQLNLSLKIQLQAIKTISCRLFITLKISFCTLEGMMVPFSPGIMIQGTGNSAYTRMILLVFPMIISKVNLSTNFLFLMLELTQKFVRCQPISGSDSGISTNYKIKDLLSNTIVSIQMMMDLQQSPLL
jgi:hypothetical protein